ncbi:MAG: hypothetical protein H7Y32_20040, partial [Chloroflexales bacterium]|nr:hypothetical protein [Chloroflexales bacterium]
MPHRCQHHTHGNQCTFYLSENDPSDRCPLHRERAPLLMCLRRLLGVWGRRRVIAMPTCLYLEPSDRRFRGTLRPGELVRVLAAPAAGWMQVEVLSAAT